MLKPRAIRCSFTLSYIVHSLMLDSELSLTVPVAADVIVKIGADSASKRSVSGYNRLLISDDIGPTTSSNTSTTLVLPWSWVHRMVIYTGTAVKIDVLVRSGNGLVGLEVVGGLNSKVSDDLSKPRPDCGTRQRRSSERQSLTCSVLLPVRSFSSESIARSSKKS